MRVTDGVYAAGDIAKFPLPLIQDSVSIGHWQIAHNHGHVAGRNMAGKEEAFNSIPYFWTVLFGKSLRYCGKDSCMNTCSWVFKKSLKYTALRSGLKFVNQPLCFSIAFFV